MVMVLVLPRFLANTHRCFNCFMKDLLDSVSSFWWSFHVAGCFDLLGKFFSLGFSYVFIRFVSLSGITLQIRLGSDQDDLKIFLVKEKYWAVAYETLPLYCWICPCFLLSPGTRGLPRYENSTFPPHRRWLGERLSYHRPALWSAQNPLVHLCPKDYINNIISFPYRN